MRFTCHLRSSGRCPELAQVGMRPVDMGLNYSHQGIPALAGARPQTSTVFIALLVE